MAARRERERRKTPTERRYRFASEQASLETTDAAVNGDIEETAVDDAPARRSRAARETVATATPTTTRGGVAREHLPFSAYRAEYAYVFGDLRRVAVVIGSLLLILLVLNFVLPH
jgi:hypothetical protein